jgi:hypothetical protein
LILLTFSKNISKVGVKQMACPVCPAAGWLGGWFGGYFGIEPPTHPGGRELSAAITANLIAITAIALKALFNISLCAGGGFTLKNILLVGAKGIILGVIYSIGVNYLLNRYVFPSAGVQQGAEEIYDKSAQNFDLEDPPCCGCKYRVERTE